MLGSLDVLTLLVNHRGNFVLMYLTSRFRILVQIIAHGCPVPCAGGVLLTVRCHKNYQVVCVCAFCTLDTTLVFTLLGVFSGPYMGSSLSNFDTQTRSLLVACMGRCYTLG